MSTVPNFDHVAGFYDPLARLVFGPLLVRAQRAALRAGLPAAAGARRVLFIGGGTGRVLPELLHQAPTTEVLYLEASARMLRQAEKQLDGAPPSLLRRVQFRHGTEADLRPDEQFDVILAFFLFDLFPPAELDAMLARLQRHAHAGTRWLVADFAPPRRPWQRGLQWLMYRFFGLTASVRGRQLPDIAGALTGLGLRPGWEQHWADGLVQAGAWQRRPDA